VALAVLIGIFARVAAFGDLPPGLNQDEASTGVDAFSLLRFGIDRNGIAFPVQFISWGSGQNALYAYATIPVLAIAGLSPIAVRLPMLISGLLTLPLMYFVARRTFGPAAAAIATFLLAISPWHIVLSRWGLESNFLPFVFMLAYACLLASSTRNFWFVVSCGLFAIALYAYGTAYAAVPLFLLAAVPILWRANRLTPGTVLLGGAVFVGVATPIVVFLVINALGEDGGVQLGPLTVPRLPIEARYETLSALSSSSPASAFIMNSRALLMLLVRQTDDLVWNTVPQFGYFYGVTLPIVLIGGVQLLAACRKHRLPEHALLIVWLGVGLVIGMLQPVNINRLNILFIPLLLLMALPIVWLAERSRIALGAAVGILLIGFAAFTLVYHGPQFRRQLDAGVLYWPGARTGLCRPSGTRSVGPHLCHESAEHALYLRAVR